ncbi:MAG: acyl carrier protein [Bacteroidia bacterium]|jgi:acyl carrier protein
MTVDKSKISNMMIQFLKANVLGEGVEISGTTPFVEIGIDSVTVIELVMHIDDEFGIDIPPNDLTEDNMSSVDTLANCAMRFAPAGGDNS